MELGPLEQLGQLNPVVEVIEAPGLILGVLPQARGLMATAHFDKGIEDKRLSGSRLAIGCGHDWELSKGIA